MHIRDQKARRMSACHCAMLRPPRDQIRGCTNHAGAHEADPAVRAQHPVNDRAGQHRGDGRELRRQEAPPQRKMRRSPYWVD